MGPLSGILRNYALKAEAQEDLEAEALRGTCQLLWTIVTVRSVDCSASGLQDSLYRWEHVVMMTAEW